MERIRLYPVKGFDPIEVGTADVTAAGTLAGDRKYAMCDPGADAIETGEDVQFRAYNGKQSDRLHELATDFDPGTEAFDVETAEEHRAFELGTADGRAAASEWLGSYLDLAVEVRVDAPPSFVDRPDLGPSVISAATLEEVASWYDEMTVENARQRLRANVEVSGVPAFWEDRFVGEDAPAFEVNGVRFEGAEPCARCVVPERDPETGEPLAGFRETFLRRREATFPEWGDREAFEHLYAVMLISRIPAPSRDGRIRVGDDVRVVERAK
ncbi:hypothetical protein MBEHAL_1096 [Halarchaeum acidiphilum MH1-52-1]|uniref:MOSC domain-containing protein n=1 Tax=Halarchaeum acidiphilum MH1-52-1 TaxID=1261545 RepID=U2YES2_9EURY|nr:hypothetical protein MBEHAL_1096 [Halarchaeum acidiphilum MH1-52-1]